MNLSFDYQNWFSFLIGTFIWVLFSITYFKFTQGFGKFIFALLTIFYIIIYIKHPVVSIFIGAIGSVSIFIWHKLKSKRKQKYKKAIAKFEAGGIRRGLTPPEIAAVFGKPFHQILTLILMGLLEKGFIVVEDQNNGKFKVPTSMETRTYSLNKDKRAKLRRSGAQELKQILYQFEEPFLELLEQEDGKGIANIDFSVTVKPFYHSLEKRVSGFDLEKTREYYENILRRIFENKKFVGSLNNDRKQSTEWNLLNYYLDEKYSLDLDKLPNWFLYDNDISDKLRSNKILNKWINSLEDKIKSRLSQENIKLSLDRMMNENSSEYLQEIIHSTYHM